MKQPRLSVGTPYIHTEVSIEASLSALTPRVEQAIAALLNMTTDDWRAQPDRVKVKQLVDFQTAGAVAATLAAASRATAELEAAAFASGIQPTPEGEEQLVERVVDALHRRGMVVVNPQRAMRLIMVEAATFAATSEKIQQSLSRGSK